MFEKLARHFMSVRPRATWSPKCSPRSFNAGQPLVKAGFPADGPGSSVG